MHIAGPDEHPVPPELAIPFAPEPIYPPNTDTERQFTALCLLILGEQRPYGKNERRACGRALWRGKRHKFVIRDGKLEREHVPTKKALGLAGILGCSIRKIERMLRVARAARLFDVWQMPAKAARIGEKGKKYGYAVFRWLTDIPLELVRRLRESALRKRPDRAPPAVTAVAPKEIVPVAAPAPDGGELPAGVDTLIADTLARLRGPARAPP